MGAIIPLNREQKLVLLKALKDGCVDYDELARVKLRPGDKYDHMTEEEFKAEIVHHCLLESEYPDVVEQCCKKRYQCGTGCYLSTYFWKIAPNRDVYDAIKAAFVRLYEKAD